MAKRENREEVEKILRSLNRGKKHKPWIELPEFRVLTEFEFGPGDNDANFYPSKGYPVKVFINTDSGELKLYGAYIFKT